MPCEINHGKIGISNQQRRGGHCQNGQVDVGTVVGPCRCGHRRRSVDERKPEKADRVSVEAVDSLSLALSLSLSLSWTSWGWAFHRPLLLSTTY
jgi:hypothetical protein